MSNPLAAIGEGASRAELNRAVNQQIVHTTIAFGIEDQKKAKQVRGEDGQIVSNGGASTAEPGTPSVKTGSVHDTGAIKTSATTDGKGMERKASDGYAKANKLATIKAAAVGHANDNHCPAVNDNDAAPVLLRGAAT